MTFAAATPARAPSTWAAMYAGVSRQGSPPRQASASVTAGLKWAPEMGPKARTRATRAAPVATVLARRASAT